MIDTIKQDAAVYQYLLLVVVILEGLFLMHKFKQKGIVITYNSIHPGHILAIIVFLLLGTSDGSDRETYRLMFDNTVEYGFFFDRSIGWAAINILISQLTSDASLFFLVIAFVYVFSTFCFCKKVVTNYSLLFLAAISFFGFYGMGTNTLKSGISLALCLWAFYYHKSKVKFFVISLFSILLHTTAIFPLLAFYMYKYMNSTKTALRIWLGCLIVSFVIGPIIITYIGSYVTDDYMSGYFEGTSDAYNVGFRYDFILYSLLPIALGYYYQYKKKYYDEFWHRLYITYILTNSIWLLLIRIPYTDRFAYLSWFLFPFILLMPYLKGFPIKKNIYSAYKILFFLWLFNFLLFLR